VDRRRDGAGDRQRHASERSRSEEQARYDGPEIDESITGRELDRSVAQQLRGLPEKLAARVARHLVAAGMLLDEDPKTAYRHTLAARARAARIAVVREACGEAAYAAGEYAEALSELRAAKRMNGSQEYLPVMADCERALGRPDRALTLARNPAVANLAPELKAEMTIVEAGARRDLGELDAALRTLENAPLRSKARADWVVRLRYAYADTLLAAGRREEAVEWFHRTVGIDGEEITDAADRVTELERSQSS
jgi:tetratricopeptide (TPR) repeat protein